MNKNLLKAQVSILLVQGIIGLRSDLAIVQDKLQEKLKTEIAIEDVEDCMIELQFDNEVEMKEKIMYYLESKNG